MDTGDVLFKFRIDTQSQTKVKDQKQQKSEK